MFKNKLLLSLIILTIVIIIAAFIAKSKGWIGDEGLLQVATETVANQTIIETVSASGKIYPELEVKISPDVSGEIRELYVQEGDSVKAGQVLAKINPDLYKSNVERTTAALNAANSNVASSRSTQERLQTQYQKALTDYNRQKQLYNDKVISQVEFLNAEITMKTAQSELKNAEEAINAAKFNINSAEANVKESNQNLNKTTIVAPMTGIVSKLNVEKGERVVGTSQMPGTEMLRIANLNNMEVRVDVNESDVVKIHLGDSVNIKVDAYTNKTFKGLVSKIANSSSATGVGTAEQATTFTIRIKILNNNKENNSNDLLFRPGMSATVSIITHIEKDIIAIPIQSVTLRDDSTLLKNKANNADVQTEVIYKYNKGQVQETKVTTGIQNEKYIQILSGVALNEKVVVAPYSAISRKLKNKQKVQEVAKEKLISEVEK